MRTWWRRGPRRTGAGSPGSGASPSPRRPLGALVVDKPLRSGQQVYARGRDLVVLAMVNAGAEVIADGHIHVYAPLRGKAMAGARGNTEARIFSFALEAELLSIAGVYRTSEHPLPPGMAGKPTQVRLVPGDEGDKLVMNVMSDLSPARASKPFDKLSLPFPRKFKNGKNHRGHLRQGRRGQNHHQRQLCHRPGAARP
jgi:hypothetical protein